MSPCYSGLVLFDPAKSQESVDTVIPELADRWSWQDNYRNLVFFLKKNVKWHDGQSLHLSRRQVHLRRGSRGAGRAGQVETERAQGLVCQRGGHRGARSPHGGIPAQAPAAVFPPHARLRLFARVPGPRSPRRAAPALCRHRALPHEAVRPRSAHRARAKPRLLRAGRPYLDGIRYTIISERGTRLAALQTGRVDAFVPSR